MFQVDIVEAGNKSRNDCDFRHESECDKWYLCWHLCQWREMSCRAMRWQRSRDRGGPNGGGEWLSLFSIHDMKSGEALRSEVDRCSCHRFETDQILIAFTTKFQQRQEYLE